MKKILITGSNRGIGLALTRRYLSNGDSVFATCRSPGTATALHDLEKEHPERIVVLGLDTVDPASHEGLRNEIVERDGAIDILVNNAGVYVNDPNLGPESIHHTIRGFDPERSIEFFRANAIAHLALTRALLPFLEKGNKPRIAFLSSGLGSIDRKRGGGVEYSYSASKAALNMFARVLANELAPQGILVVTLDPGWVKTDMGTSAAPLEPEPVADGLYRVIRDLDRSRSGTFINWRGESVAW
jgi:NAD(P)-dependent dehydrogenase (short-subunit alcohol dehydrogenase family)